MHCSEGAWHMTSTLVMVLCNQPEAFALDLGDDHSRYLFSERCLFNIDHSATYDIVVLMAFQLVWTILQTFLFSIFKCF